MKFSLAARIVVGMVTGIATGVVCHAVLPDADARARSAPTSRSSPRCFYSWLK